MAFIGHVPFDFAGTGPAKAALDAAFRLHLGHFLSFN
jgi:hypothetical protein